MIIKISIGQPDQRIESEYYDDELQFELWEDDNVVIRRNEYDGKMPDILHEIKKEDAVILAKQILSFYGANKRD
jgi:hypothetical protein